MKIICFVRNRYINQGCGVGEAISTAPAPTNPAPEKYDCYCDSGSEQNVLAPPAPALVLAKKSDTGGSCFCCMGHGPYFNYHLLTLVNKFSGAGALVSSPAPTPAALVSSLTRDADQHH